MLASCCIPRHLLPCCQRTMHHPTSPSTLPGPTPVGPPHIEVEHAPSTRGGLTRMSLPCPSSACWMAGSWLAGQDSGTEVVRKLSRNTSVTVPLALVAGSTLHMEATGRGVSQNIQRVLPCMIIHLNKWPEQHPPGSFGTAAAWSTSTQAPHTPPTPPAPSPLNPLLAPAHQATCTAPRLRLQLKMLYTGQSLVVPLHASRVSSHEGKV
jgi:hypothetical protein